MSRQLRVRPNPVGSFFGGIVGLVFVVLGLTLAIPTFGAFGIFWTVVAVVIMGTNFYNAFSKEGIADKLIELPDDPILPPTPVDAETRLRNLRDLRAKGLITAEEYAARRAAVIGGI